MYKIVQFTLHLVFVLFIVTAAFFNILSIYLSSRVKPFIVISKLAIIAIESCLLYYQKKKKKPIAIKLGFSTPNFATSVLRQEAKYSPNAS